LNYSNWLRSDRADETPQSGHAKAPQRAKGRCASRQAAPAIDFIKPLTPDAEKTSPQLFNILNFLLQFCPTDPSETELIARFAKINVGAGKTLDASTLSPEIKAAVEQGMADAWADFAGLLKQVDAGKVTSGDLFGTREYLKKNYLYRMAAAVLGFTATRSRRRCIRFMPSMPMEGS
jgi:hypothetical protein